MMYMEKERGRLSLNISFYMEQKYLLGKDKSVELF